MGRTRSPSVTMFWEKISRNRFAEAGKRCSQEVRQANLLQRKRGCISTVSWAQRGITTPKGNQSWAFIERTDVEAETPILWPPDSKSWLTWKDPDAGKDWRRGKKRKTEDEMVGWQHQLDGPGFRWTWVWMDSGSWWWTGRPGVLQFMGSQRVGHDWVTGLNWMIHVAIISHAYFPFTYFIWWDINISSDILPVVFLWLSFKSSLDFFFSC